jgi:putative peptidoglycan lipid II flippase
LIGPLDGRRVATAYGRIAAAAAVAAGVAFGVWFGLDEALGRTLGAQIVAMAVALAAGAGSYLVAARALGVRELDVLLSLIRRSGKTAA